MSELFDPEKKREDEIDAFFSLLDLVPDYEAPATVEEEEEREGKARGLIENLTQGIKEIQAEPIRALPFLLETGGAIVGAAGGPIGSATGSVLGRAAGEAIEAAVRGTNPFTLDNAIELFAAPLGSLPFGTITGFFKKAATDKAVASGFKAELVRTIVEPPHIPTTADEAIEQGFANTWKLRETFYINEAAKALFGDSVKAAAIKEPAEKIIVPGLKELFGDAGSSFGIVPSGNEAVDTIATLLGKQASEQFADPTFVERQAKGKSLLQSLTEEQARLPQATQRVPFYLHDTLTDLRRKALTDPDIPSDEITQMGQTLGLGASLFSNQVVLRKSGDPVLTRIADWELLGQETKASLDNYFLPKLDALWAKHGMKKRDAMLIDILSANPDLIERALADELPLAGKSADEVKRVASFLTELRNVNDEAFALAVRNTKDPSKIGPYVTQYFPTGVGPRHAAQLADDIKRLEKEFADLTPEEAASEFGAQLQSYINGLYRKLNIAQDRAPEVEKALLEGRRLLELGITPSSPAFGALKQRTAKLVTSADPKAALADYYTGLNRKIVLDNVLPELRQLHKQIANPRTKEYVGKSILALTGQRQASSLVRIANVVQAAGNSFGIKALKNYTPDKVADTLDGINKWVFRLQIGLNPRFVFQNLLQPIVTLRPLVGDEGMAAAFKEVFTNYKELAKRAQQAGVINPDEIGQLGEGLMTKTGHKLTRIMTWGPEGTEKINRLLAFAAGEWHAKNAGLTGKDAARKAAAIAKMTNFGYGIAEKPQITTTPLGSMLYRFRSFTANYASYLNFLRREKNYKALAEALVSTFALSGTTGIPLYDFIRGQFASRGYYLPQVDPIEEMTSVDFGQSLDPFFRLPKQPTEALGPIFGPPTKLATAIARGDALERDFAIQQMLGPASRVVSGIGEYVRGGETRTRGRGELLARRSVDEIAQAALNFGPTARQGRGQIMQELELAIQAKDPEARRKILRKARQEGYTNLSHLVSQAKSRVKRGEEESLLRTLMGE